MKHLANLRFALVLLLMAVTVLANATYRGGYLDAGRKRTLNDIKIEKIEAREQWYVVDGWRTYIVSRSLPKNYIPRGSSIKGRYMSDINRVLDLLEEDGYKTVDITLWEGQQRTLWTPGTWGGWEITGK